MADTTKGLKDKLRNNYYTIDLEMQKNQFFYQDLLDTEEFRLVKTQEFLYYYILYKDEVNSVYVKYLEKYFTDLFCWDALD